MTDEPHRGVPHRPVPQPPVPRSTTQVPPDLGHDGATAGVTPAVVPRPGPAPDSTDHALATLGAALRPLDTLADRPVDEHPAVFESVLETLQRTLSESDS